MARGLDEKGPVAPGQAVAPGGADTKIIPAQRHIQAAFPKHRFQGGLGFERPAQIDQGKGGKPLGPVGEIAGGQLPGLPGLGFDAAGIGRTFEQVPEVPFPARRQLPGPERRPSSARRPRVGQVAWRQIEFGKEHLGPAAMARHEQPVESLPGTAPHGRQEPGLPGAVDIVGLGQFRPHPAQCPGKAVQNLPVPGHEMEPLDPGPSGLGQDPGREGQKHRRGYVGGQIAESIRLRARCAAHGPGGPSQQARGRIESGQRPGQPRLPGSQPGRRREPGAYPEPARHPDIADRIVPHMAQGLGRHAFPGQDVAEQPSRPFAKPDLTRDVQSVAVPVKPVRGQLLPDKIAGQVHVRDKDDAPALGPECPNRRAHGLDRAQAGGFGSKFGPVQRLGRDAPAVRDRQARADRVQGEVLPVDQIPSGLGLGNGAQPHDVVDLGLGKGFRPVRPQTPGRGGKDIRRPGMNPGQAGVEDVEGKDRVHGGPGQAWRRGCAWGRQTRR